MTSSGKRVGDRPDVDPDVPPAPATPRFGRGTHRDVTHDAAAAELSLRDENLASIAHDLRNPLAIIALEAARLQHELADPNHRRSVHRIAKNVTFMEKLITDLLDLSRAEAGRLRLRVQLVDLARLIEHVIDRAVSSADRPRITLEMRDPATVRVDRTRLSRVIENLVANALRFGPPHSPVVVRTEVRGARAIASVIDAGPGLSAEQARRAFDRHWQAHPQGGYGLGLHLCRMIVEAHAGRIGVESVPGRGSRFFFDLPLVR